MFFIETERLKLIPLTHEQLVLWRRDRVAMESVIGLNISAMQIDPLYQAELIDALDNFWILKRWQILTGLNGTPTGRLC